METSLLYGKGELNIQLPTANTTVIEPVDIPGINDAYEAVKQALSKPIASKPLPDRVKSSDKVAIVISDITRPTPNHILVPAIIDALSHVPYENFTIINGTGTHRDQTKEEFIEMLGEWIVDNIKIINNQCHNQETLVNLGTSTFGCDVYLNKTYVEADFRIVTGFIEPHFFAGFSGGPKGIMPGIAGIETIKTFHNAQMIGNPKATWGNLKDNPLQIMTREINEMCPPDFMLNVTLNRSKEITAIFAGALIAAHEEGCAYVKEHTMIPCAEPFDIVITSNAGYPLDQNLYQAVKGMSAAHQIVKEGGTIIIAAECSDGFPDHGNFADIFKLADSPAALLEMIKQPQFSMFDQWQVQKQATIQMWADIYVYASLTDADVKSAFLHPTKDITATVQALLKKYGKDASIAVLPLGPLTIPYVSS